MLKQCCSAALCAGLLVPFAWGQDKPAAPGASKPQAAKPKAKGASAEAKKRAPETQKGSAAESGSAGVKAIEQIFACVAQGLPQDWGRAWVAVTELSGTGKERTFEGQFFYSVDSEGAKPQTLVPCDARDVAERVYALNDFLEPEKWQWKVATLIFTRDGKFELKYDYTR